MTNPFAEDRLAFLQRHLLHLQNVRINLVRIRHHFELSVPSDAGRGISQAVLGCLCSPVAMHVLECGAIVYDFAVEIDRWLATTSTVGLAPADIYADACTRMLQDLELRAEKHDLTKWWPDEFDGFARISGSASRVAYGTPEYKAAFDTEAGPGGAIALHFQRNTHHPEHHGPAEAAVGERGIDRMGWLDIIEMVADWRAAQDTYDAWRPPESRVDWKTSVERSLDRFAPVGWRHWLVTQLVDFYAETP